MKTQEWLLPETAASFNELPLQYNGFCGYTLVKRDGFLLPGTVVIKYTRGKPNQVNSSQVYLYNRLHMIGINSMCFKIKSKKIYNNTKIGKNARDI